MILVAHELIWLWRPSFAPFMVRPVVPFSRLLGSRDLSLLSDDFSTATLPSLAHLECSEHSPRICHVRQSLPLLKPPVADEHRRETREQRIGTIRDRVSLASPNISLCFVAHTVYTS